MAVAVRIKAVTILLGAIAALLAAVTARADIPVTCDVDQRARPWEVPTK